MVSDVSVHGHLAPLLLGLWQCRDIMGEGHGGRKQPGSRETENKSPGQNMSFKDMPSISYFSN
jgi:hypothetical protein